MSDTLAGRLAFGVALLVVFLPILMGGAAVADAGVFGASAEEDASDSIIFGLISMLAGAIMLSGLLLSRSSPRLGLAVLAVGVVGISAFWYWMFVITIPVGAALLVVTYLRGRGAGWPHGTGAA